MNFEGYVSELDSVLRPDESFDIIRREYLPKHGRCVFASTVDARVFDEAIVRSVNQCIGIK